MNSTPDLEPKLQAFHDIYMELRPYNNLNTYERVRRGIKYCFDIDFDIDLEPEDALLDLRECSMPFINVS